MMDLFDKYYTPAQREILHQLGKLSEETFEHLPVIQSKITDAFPIWPKANSVDFLRTEEFDVRFVRTNDENDLNSSYYVFMTPDEGLLWHGGQVCCPECKASGSHNIKSNGYASRPNQLKDLPWRGKRVVYVIMHKRYLCRRCSTTFQADWSSFADAKAEHSNRHKRQIGIDAMSKKTFESVAYEHFVDDSTVKAYFKQEVEHRKTECKIETPKHIGIDEAKVHTKDGSHFYVVILATGNDTTKNNGVIEFDDVTRDAETIKEVFRRLDNPDAVETITMDMCKAYREAAEDILHNARIIVDRFHLVKSLNDKVALIAKKLYASKKRELESALGIKSFPIEFDSALIEEPVNEEKMIQDLKETLDIPLALTDFTKGIKVSTDLPEKEYLARKLDILKQCYYYRWFTMNPNKLSDLSLVRFYTLFVNFPEFKNLYDIKEKLRYNFFMAPNADAARKIAKEAKAMIPKGAIYKPLRTYFGTLESAEWSRHIYAYFDDPIDDPAIPLPEGATPKKRYTNAKLEGFNRIVKEINAVSRGLNWEELKAKILYGDLAVKHRPRRFPRTKKATPSPSEEMLMEYISSVVNFLDYRSIISPPHHVWETVFSVPAMQSALQSWGLYERMNTDELLAMMEENNNLRGAIFSILTDKEAIISNVPASDETSNDLGDTGEELPIIRYLRFSDWEANRELYLSMIASDLKFLNNLRDAP